MKQIKRFDVSACFRGHEMGPIFRGSPKQWESMVILRDFSFIEDCFGLVIYWPLFLGGPSIFFLRSLEDAGKPHKSCNAHHGGCEPSCSKNIYLCDTPLRTWCLFTGNTCCFCYISCQLDRNLQMITFQLGKVESTHVLYIHWHMEVPFNVVNWIYLLFLSLTIWVQ